MRRSPILAAATIAAVLALVACSSPNPSQIADVAHVADEIGKFDEGVEAFAAMGDILGGEADAARILTDLGARATDEVEWLSKANLPDSVRIPYAHLVGSLKASALPNVDARPDYLRSLMTLVPGWRLDISVARETAQKVLTK